MQFSSPHALVGESAIPGFRGPPTAREQNSRSALHSFGPLNVSIEIVDELGSVSILWQVFEKIADCTPFQTFGWLDHWQRCVGANKGTQPIVVLGRSNDGEILFILPLAIERHGLLRRLTWLGMELGDYNGPLLAENFSRHPAASDFTALWNSIVGALHSDARYHFDLADLPKMPEMIGAQKNPFLQLKVMPTRSGAYLAILGTDWDSYFKSKRSASTRKTLRKKQRHLEAYGEIRFVADTEPEASARTLKTLIEQKSRAFARMGVENIFQRPGYAEFYEAVVTDPEIRDVVHVSHLDVGVTMAATNVALRFRERYYLILSSYHGGEMARFGPGRSHLHELLRYTIENGFRYFDFTIGDEPYKLDWSDSKLVLYDHLAPFTLRGRAVAAAVALQRRAIRFIKQTPALWHLAVNVRALLGRRKRKADEDAAE